MAKPLSKNMREALAMVPAKWESAMPLVYRPPTIGGRRYKSGPLTNAAFRPLRDGGLIEFRGGPGKWEWRLTKLGRAYRAAETEGKAL